MIQTEIDYDSKRENFLFKFEKLVGWITKLL